MTNISKGTLYGIGVGPGDPDLLTLKAVQVLRRVKHIFASSSSKNGFSVAEGIMRPHLREGVEVRRLRFPMTNDVEVLQHAWEENTHKLVQCLDQGEDVVLVTLGDPLLYSTVGYILRTLRRAYPDYPVEIIPGITSFQQAAALTQTILAEGEQPLHILAGTMSEDALAETLSQKGNFVILKAYKNFTVIREQLRHNNMAHDCVYASRIGLEREKICRGIENLVEDPTYLTLLLANSYEKPA